MADKGAKSKQSKREDPSVLGALPATRPARLSRRSRNGDGGGESPATPRKAGPAPRKDKAAGRASAPEATGAAPTGATPSKVEAAAAKAGRTSPKKAAKKGKRKGATSSPAAKAGAPAKAAAAEAGAKARAAPAAAKPRSAAEPTAVTPPAAPSPQGTEPPETVATAVAETAATPRKAGPVPLASADKRPRPVRAADPGLREPAEKASAQREEQDDARDLVETVVQAAGELTSVGGRLLKGLRGRLPL